MLRGSTRTAGGTALAERATEKPSAASDSSRAAQALPPAAEAGAAGTAAPPPGVALTARLRIEYFTDGEARALSLFVYLSTLLLLVATSALVALKFLSNEQVVLFKTNTW